MEIGKLSLRIRLEELLHGFTYLGYRRVGHSFLEREESFEP